MDSATAYDLLREPLLTLDRGGARQTADLPTALALLSRGEDVEFAYLQQHQFHPWFAFLVQLAALALEKAGLETPPAEADVWRAMLEALAAPHETAFALVNDDLSQPAFMQPPVPEGLLPGGTVLSSPVDADLIITSKNHEIKASRARHARAEHWLLALVVLQTASGYKLKRGHAISRMASGSGSNCSRPFFSPGGIDAGIRL